MKLVHRRFSGGFVEVAKEVNRLGMAQHLIAVNASTVPASERDMRGNIRAVPVADCLFLVEPGFSWADWETIVAEKRHDA
jgi:hypothetical protein